MTRTRIGLLALLATLAAGVWWIRPSPPAPDPAEPVSPVEALEPPLPEQEVFVPRDDLRVSLLTDTPVIRLGDGLRLTLRFRNDGTEPILMMPRHPFPGPLSWQTRSGPPPDQFDFDGYTREATRADLVALTPGETWDMPLRYEGLDQPIRLPPGVHEVGVTYANYFDYMFHQYDPYASPSNVWEGMAVADPVRITIEAPSPDTVTRWMDSLVSDLPDRVTLELLALSGPEGVAALIDLIRTAPDDGRVHLAIVALAAAERLPADDLMNALNAAGPRGRGRLPDAAQFLLPSRTTVDCTLLAYFFVNLTSLPGPYDELFAPGVAACPSVAASLRAALVDPAQAYTTRANAAELLALYRDASDVPLLIDAFEGRLSSASTLAPNQAAAIRSGATAGLARFPRPEVVGALARVLADRRQNSWLRRAAAGALSRIGGTAVVPPLVDAFSSDDPEVVVSAVTGLADVLDGLSDMRAPEAMPRLLDLLRHRNPRFRMLAARALRQLDDPNARDAMVAALDDVDSSVRTTAFFFLAKHGDETLRARAMSALQQNRQDSGDNVGEAAAALLARFGTPDDAAQVRQLLDVVDDPYVHGGLLRALGRLTFVATHSSGDLPEWDAWYAQHRDETRVEWALDALRRAEEGSFLAGLWPVQVAMPYLAALGDARVVDHLERATDSRRWGVRVEAARAILTFDRAKGMRLLIRELTGRSYEACMTAHWTLNRLVGERRDIDCRSPAARNTAAADWRATEVPPGVLPQLW